jgi:isocitrate/isopropylmalate dehydrogenase
MYARFEYLPPPWFSKSLRGVSFKDWARIAQMAIEVAPSKSRQLVHCGTNSKVRKFTERLMEHTFEAITPEYPDKESRHIVIDSCPHQLINIRYKSR